MKKILDLISEEMQQAFEAAIRPDTYRIVITMDR